MSKMSPALIRAAKSAAKLSMRVNKLDLYGDTTGEDSLATLVISLADHIESLEEDVEYEYTVLRGDKRGFESAPGPSQWLNSLETAQHQLECLEALFDGPYRIVKRRKAGKVENV